MEDVIVLNADHSFINRVSWQKAISLIYKGKAEPAALSDKTIYNFGRTYSIVVPKIIRLVKMVKDLFKAKAPYSKKNVFLRDKCTCMYCNTIMTVGSCTIDHVFPSSLGGKTSWENCVTACKKCNNKKGDSLLHETGMALRRKPYHPTIHEFYLMFVKFHGIDKIIEEVIG